MFAHCSCIVMNASSTLYSARFLAKQDVCNLEQVGRFWMSLGVEPHL